MAMINMINNIKELFPDYILLVKIGNFYETYNNDTYIISNLFYYKIRNMNNYNSCGFPINSINKVKYILENRNINYLIIDKKHNYEEIEKMNYKKKNNYNNILKESKEKIDKINRIEKIKNYLLNDSTKLDSIEKLLYE